MQSIEKEILDAITVNGVWIIILLVAIFVFCVGIYTLLKRLIKLEKQKKEDRVIIIQKFNYTTNLLERILNSQAQEQTNKFRNNYQPNNANNTNSIQSNKTQNNNSYHNKWL